MRLALILCLCLAAGSSALRPTSPPESLLDRALDWTLELYRATRSGPLALPVPSLRQPFVQGLVPGELRASGGYFGDFATLRRTSRAQGRRDGTRLSLVADLVIEDFAIGYRNYSVKFGQSWESGELVVRAAENSLLLEVELDLLRPWCSLSVSLSLKGVMGPRTEVLGLAEYRPLVEVLSRWVVNTYSRRLLAWANLELRAVHDGIAAKVCRRSEQGLSPLPSSLLQFQVGWDECIIHKCAAFPV